MPWLLPKPRPVTDADTRDYFERRAQEEIAAAEHAADLRAAQSHRELANRYRDLAQAGRAPRDEGAEESEPRIVSSEFRIVP